ncbi:MAG: dienelactone hydrolase family protein [Phycisphaerales bacterium JB054]
MQNARPLRRLCLGLVMGFAAALGAGASAQTQQEPSPVPTASPSPFEAGAVTIESGESFGYRLLTPPADAERPEGGWPLIVFLHGAGERGDDNEAQLRHFPERMASAEYRERFPCYVLAVQCPREQRWADFAWNRAEEAPEGAPTSIEREPTGPMRGAMAAIEEVVAEWPIDLHRITLTGLSMGGFGSWDLAARKPDWFAAVAPICGGGDPRVAEQYKGLPFWVWHDEGDPVVPVALSQRMVEAAKAAGVDVRYSEVSGHGHASWVPAYEVDKLPAWLLSHRRDEPSEELAALRAQD